VSAAETSPFFGPAVEPQEPSVYEQAAEAARGLERVAAHIRSRIGEDRVHGRAGLNVDIAQGRALLDLIARLP
jgi:hypothetical protein